MTDPKRQNDDAANPAAEPVVSKPYIMPDDPETGSVEALAKEAAESRDKMLRTLAEMENLRKRTAREVADARVYGITGFARDVLDIAAADADIAQLMVRKLGQFAYRRAISTPGVQSLRDRLEGDHFLYSYFVLSSCLFAALRSDCSSQEAVGSQ